MANEDFPARVLDQNKYPNIASFMARSGLDNPVNTVGSIRERALAEVGELAIINPTIRFGIELSIGNLMGTSGLQPQACINPEAVGMTPKQAEKLGEAFEDVFNEWAASNLASGSEDMDLPSLLQPAMRRAFSCGELLLAIGWRPANDFGPSARWSTMVKSLDPQRISRNGASSYDIPEGHKILQGVEICEDTGRIEALYLRGNQPAYGFQQVEVYKGVGDRIPVRNQWGRPQLVYSIMDRAGPGVVRGYSPILSAVERAIRLDDLSGATYEQVMAQLQIAWSLVSDLSTNEAMAATVGTPEQRKAFVDSYIDSLDAHLGRVKLQLPKGARLSILPQGAKLDTTSPNLPGLGLEPTTRRLLLEISRALGVSYADLTSDFASETFSSSRMGQISPWTITYQRRRSFVAPIFATLYRCVVEEALLKRYVTLPEGATPFYAAVDAYTASTWTGPARPVVDPEKEANANDTELANGTASYSSIAAERGQDWREVADQRIKEIKYFRKAGVPLIAGGVDLTTGQAVSGNSKPKTPAPDNKEALKNAA